jgi:farnesyl diphosphate synthase
MPTHFQAWMHAQQQRIESVLDTLLPVHLIPHSLQTAMRYAVLDGGKRVRPLLVLAAGELVNAPTKRVEQVAAALELIHVYSLVHDDLPAMDDDVLRRGKATCHIQFGEANAILTGDALQTRAFEILSTPDLCDDPQKQLILIQLLAHATGASGMCGGQAFDLASVGQHLDLPMLEMMHRMKTGALIRAAVLMGVYCGETLTDQQLIQLDRFAKCIGLVFQVIDDILDTEGDTLVLGKTAGKDAKNSKPTYVSLLGLKGAKEKAEKLHEEALSHIEQFGVSAARLRALADFIIKRHH